MANPSTVHEPSMEEILASIRQIISEDGEGTSGEAHEAVHDDPDQPERRGQAEDERSPYVQRSGHPGEAMKSSNSESAARSVAAPPAEPAPRQAVDGASQPRPAPVARSGADQAGDRGLMSRDSDAVVSGAFSALAHTILAQNARTLEDLVSEMVRPMLKDWLDENLPSLVERLVREEIERVSRGRR